MTPSGAVTAKPADRGRAHRGQIRQPSAVTECQVPGCIRTASRGEDWTSKAIEPIVAFRLGTELRLKVRDLAVVLALCEDHANVVSSSAWDAVEATLASWEWRPLGS